MEREGVGYLSGGTPHVEELPPKKKVFFTHKGEKFNKTLMEISTVLES